jgi:transcriptional regulator with XRE-family HTH domain
MVSEASLLRALGKRVRELRKERGYSQEKLAELASVHENHVRRIEGGKANPSFLVVVRIAKALGARPSELLDRITTQ